MRSERLSFQLGVRSYRLVSTGGTARYKACKSKAIMISVRTARWPRPDHARDRNLSDRARAEFTKNCVRGVFFWEGRIDDSLWRVFGFLKYENSVPFLLHKLTPSLTRKYFSYYVVSWHSNKGFKSRVSHTVQIIPVAHSSAKTWQLKLSGRRMLKGLT
jgi:hypothetical protein